MGQGAMGGELRVFYNKECQDDIFNEDFTPRKLEKKGKSRADDYVILSDDLGLKLRNRASPSALLELKVRTDFDEESGVEIWKKILACKIGVATLMQKNSAFVKQNDVDTIVQCLEENVDDEEWRTRVLEQIGEQMEVYGGLRVVKVEKKVRKTSSTVFGSEVADDFAKVTLTSWDEEKGEKIEINCKTQCFEGAGKQTLQSISKELFRVDNEELEKLGVVIGGYPSGLARIVFGVRESNEV